MAGDLMPLPWHRGWMPVVVLPGVVVAAFPAGWPRWGFMWGLSFAIYCGCKWLTWRRTPADGVPIARQLGYLLAWPGLDAPAFLHSANDGDVPKPTAGEWTFAAAKFLFGVALIGGVARWVPSDYPYLVGWIGLIGLVMILHFGIFHLLSCAWRTIGVDAPPLMDWPVFSQSVSEFWGRRWNRAFRDLTHRFLFRPLTTKIGPRWGLAVGFVFSGLVHDAVISYPAGGGYGGPTLFFLIQASAMFVERSRRGRRAGLGRGWRGNVFAAVVLIAPVRAALAPAGVPLVFSFHEGNRLEDSMSTPPKSLIGRNSVFAWIAVATCCLLLIPLIAMQFTEVNWNVADFIVMGLLLFGAGTVFVLAARRVPEKYRLALGVVVAGALLYVWAELAVGIFTNLGS